MARQVQPGTPTRSPRYIMPAAGGRLVLVSLAVAGLVLVLGIVLYVAGVRTVASPGHVASAHATLDTKCASCHQPGKDVAEARCERCHDPLDARRFSTPAHAALGGGAAHAAHVSETDCATCHTEHRGRSVDLAHVADRSCTACHGFRTFTAHPEVAVVRAKKEPDPGLDFSHEVHVKEVGKLGGDRCQACHRLTPDQKGYEPIAFDTHCASCHVKNGVLTLNGTDALKSLPTPAALLPAPGPGAAAPAPMPAVESRDERGRVILTGFSHRDPWVIAAADGITRMMSAPAIGFERARIVRDIARLAAIAQAVPVPGMADAGLAPLAVALTKEIQAIDAQLAAPASAQAPPVTGAPSDAQQFEERRRELTALLDAVAARADAKSAGIVAGLRKDLEALKPDAGSSASVNGAALVDRLKAVDVALGAVENAGGPALAAGVSGVRAGVNALVGGAPGAARGDVLAEQRAELVRRLDRVELELALRPTEGTAPVDAISQSERSAASRELQARRARLAVLDARIGTSADLDPARGRAALHGLVDACVKCHRLNDDETALRPVVPNQSLLQATVFSHKPHLLQAKCETCHASIATSKSGVDANVPGIANCQSCHNASQARADCVSCHEFHPRTAAQVATTLWR